jgi:hypothetical protein
MRLLSLGMGLTSALSITFAPERLITNVGGESLDRIFSSFTIARHSIATISSLFNFSKYHLQAHYDRVEEPPNRATELVRFYHLRELHDRLFGVEKLLNNPMIAAWIFKNIRYYDGNLLAWHRRAFYFTDWKLTKSILRYVIQQLGQLETLNWMTEFVDNSTLSEALWLFRKLAKGSEMLPQMLSIFLNASSGDNDEEVFLREYLSSFGLTDVELLIRLLIVRLSIHDGREPSESSQSIIREATEFIIRSADFTPGGKIIELLEELFTCVNDMTLDSLFNHLYDLAVSRRDRSFWGMLATLTLAAHKIEAIDEKRHIRSTDGLLFQNLPKSIAPFLGRKLIAFGFRMYGDGMQSIVNGISMHYLPDHMKTRDQRRELWIREGLVQVAPKNRIVEFGESKRRLLEIIYELGYLPLNFQVAPFTDFRGRQTSLFTDAIIHTARTILTSETFYSAGECYRSDEQGVYAFQVVLVAWTCLIFHGRRLNLQPLFPSGTTDPSWSDFTMRIKRRECHKTGELFQAVKATIDSMKIAKYLRPIEARRLVDPLLG